MGAVNETVTKDSTLILEGAGDVSIDGIVLGAYQGGVVMTYAQDKVFIDSDHVQGHIRAVTMNTTIQITTELEQTNLINLAIAYGIPSSSVLSGTSSTTLDITPVGDTLEHELIFYGMSATNNDYKRTLTLLKTVRVGSTGSTFYRGTKLVLPVTFECLVNSSGSMGTIVDSTIE